ncbi:HAD-like protein [Polyplosphaeria fusca]|uniref:Mitochondrial import inner membrane translocase subunit TIM50 n=1 Tax=Polyplosphaeria fusca TaxID=682080 RepID=A0A9P4QKX9_9PLEO|nr:HAD-like protein [Polyplosphaeria fusca]
MLSRAAVRALRIRPALVLPRARVAPPAFSAQWTRLYANNNRPPRRSNQDQTWRPSDPIKFSQGKRSPSTDPEEFSGSQEPQASTHSTTETAKKPLPDLRQGIPSTFEAEFLKGQAEGDPNNVTEDPAKGPTGGAGGREGGELPKSAYETSTDRRRNRVANYGYIFTLLVGVGSAVFLGRNWDTEEEERAHPDHPSGWGPALMYNRARARLNSQLGYYTEPTFEKLLPDKSPEFPVPPLTLVISLEDMLIHSEWTTKHGWRTAKRPGADYFLRYLSQHYELVIWTSLKSQDADMVIRKLDPFRIVMWPLFREATRYERGEYVKDLSKLNRDPSKVIIVDTDRSHVPHHPDNAIILPKWKGEAGDKGLVSLIPFLEYLAMMQPDVRQAIKSFDGKDIPDEFARREAKAREAFNKDMAERKAKKPKHSAGGMLMGALGLNAQPQGGMMMGDGKSVAEGFEQGKMLSDQFREQSLKQYEALEKEIRENGEKWLKEMAEEEKKMTEEAMSGMKAGVFGWLGGSQPPPPEKK